MTDCIFCKIVAGELPSYKIYEDEQYLAFLDIFPSTEGHTLVIPKEHIEWVWDHPAVGEYFAVVAKIAQHHREITGDVVRSNIDGWQVPHAHVHLKPTKENTFNAEKRSDEELAKIQQKFSML